MFGKFMSNMMIKPGKSPVFNNPRDLELDYSDVEFKAEDGITLRGWLIHGGNDKVIIQSHFGVQCSRSGYTPKGKGMIKMWKEDISFLRQAKYLQQQGYSVLLYDLRNHGESDQGSCPWISWGPEEARDIVAAVDFVTKNERYAGASIGLLSICMGSSAMTYAFGRDEKSLRDYPDLEAAVVVQPLHYKEFVKAFGFPGFLERSGRATSQERLGFDLGVKTFLRDAKNIEIPTLVMQNRNDPWTDLDFVNAFFDQLCGRKEMRWLELSKDRAAAYDYLGTNPESFTQFFDQYL